MKKNNRKELVVTGTSASAGAASAIGAVYTSGAATGLGATGITSGLCTIGSAVGGGMLTGLCAVAAAPIAFGAVGFFGYKYFKK